MTLRFEDWLSAQQERKDEIGALARIPAMQDVAQKATRRKPDEHRDWANIVIRIAQPGHVAVFNDAWQEYLLAKQAATTESLE
jgi:hypothetical protein